MLKNIDCKCQIVKNFAPSWFASVMGTGILTMTSLFYSEYIPFLKNLAYLLFYLNIILFFVLLVPWILRWILFRKEALNDLEHPVISSCNLKFLCYDSDRYACLSSGFHWNWQKYTDRGDFLVYRNAGYDILWHTYTIFNV